MNVGEIVDFVERLNLSHHKSLIGTYFPEIIALLSIVFGGSFLLFGWRHHEYFLGITGLIVGGWAGLFLKSHFSPHGASSPFLYVAACSAAGAYIGAFCKRFVGILLGGFTVALFASVFSPTLFKAGEQTMLGTAVIFLLGGGLGGLFPKFFYVLNSSLIGSVFVTYGISLAVLAPLQQISPSTRVLLHLAAFLPLFVFGLLYQGFSGTPGPSFEAPPPPRRASRPIRATVEVAD
ncbi:MAG TPA: hypothetical protein VFC90_13590 [Planctomycetota bacterium]|nr:hypothetical protein [Planctomycetota bacterium]